jgi:hypothetical protein
LCGNGLLPQFNLISVEASDNCVLPADTLWAYYGNGRANLIYDFSSVMYQRGKLIAPVAILIEKGPSPKGKVNLISLPEITTLDLASIAPEVTKEIKKYWSGYMLDEGKKISQVQEEMTKPVMLLVKKRPDLLVKLVTEARFRHLKLILTRFDDIRDRFPKKIAMICDPSAIVDLFCKGDRLCAVGRGRFMTKKD